MNPCIWRVAGDHFCQNHPSYLIMLERGFGRTNSEQSSRLLWSWTLGKTFLNTASLAFILAYIKLHPMIQTFISGTATLSVRKKEGQCHNQRSSDVTTLRLDRGMYH